MFDAFRELIDREPTLERLNDALEKFPGETLDAAQARRLLDLAVITAVGRINSDGAAELDALAQHPPSKESAGMVLRRLHARTRYVEERERSIIEAIANLAPSGSNQCITPRLGQLRAARDIVMKRNVTVLRELTGLDRIRIPKPRRTPLERKAARLFPLRVAAGIPDSPDFPPGPQALALADGDRSLLDIHRHIEHSTGRMIDLQGLIDYNLQLEDAGAVRFRAAVSRKDIVRALASAGVLRGAKVLAVAFPLTLGHIRGGNTAVVNALISAVGRTGVVVMPCGSAAAAELAAARGARSESGLIAVGRDAKKVLHHWPAAEPSVVILGEPPQPYRGIQLDARNCTCAHLGESIIRAYHWDHARAITAGLMDK